jgi:TatA/E family protein of Tat protein translocase
MFGIGTTELIIIMFIILLIFGAKKLPELAQGLGKGIREFKKASNDIQEELSMNQQDEKIKSHEPESTNDTKDDSKSDQPGPDSKKS